MQLMLTKYYSKKKTEQRHSQASFSSINPQPLKAKRSSSHGNYSALTKASEKSLKSISHHKAKPRKSTQLKSKKKPLINSQPKHRSRCSLIPKSFLKPKPSHHKAKHSLNLNSIIEPNTTLSDSYDSLLKQFSFDEKLRSSLKQLVHLEKLSIMQKFIGKNKGLCSENVSKYHSHSHRSNKTMY
jgi:hypothetical protein